MAKKKVQVVLDTVPQEQKTLWQRIKDKFYNSGTIMSAWIKMAAGTVVATTAGVLGSTDFSSILNMLKSGVLINKAQLMIMGAAAVVIGIIDYVVRVHGTKAVDGHLLPKAN